MVLPFSTACRVPWHACHFISEIGVSESDSPRACHCFASTGACLQPGALWTGKPRQQQWLRMERMEMSTPHVWHCSSSSSRGHSCSHMQRESGRHRALPWPELPRDVGTSSLRTNDFVVSFQGTALPCGNLTWVQQDVRSRWIPLIMCLATIDDGPFDCDRSGGDHRALAAQLHDRLQHKVFWAKPAVFVLEQAFA